MKLRNIILGIIWAAWVAIMFYFLEQPGEQSAVASGMVTQFILRVLKFLEIDPSELEHIIRKLAHFSVFIGSGFMCVMTLLPAKFTVPIALLIHAAFAALSEYFQTLSPGRCCSVTDMGIDFAGACIGIALACLFRALFRRLRRRSAP